MTLKVKDLGYERNDKILFQDINFSLNSGELLQIKGLNGCGKTSMLRILCGLAPPNFGEITWNNTPIQSDRDTYLQNLLYIGHHLGLKGGLTPRENLQHAIAMRSAQQKTTIDSALEHACVLHRAALLTENLSAGQKRRVALARLLLQDAALWILDEPFTALDVNGVELVTHMLKVHVENGGMAIITSHQPLKIGVGVRELTL